MSIYVSETGLIGMLPLSVAEPVFVVWAPLQLSFLVRKSCSITIWHTSVRFASSPLCSCFSSSIICERNPCFVTQIRLSSDLPNELLYGRVGYLWACLFVNKYVGAETLSSATIVRLRAIDEQHRPAFLSCKISL